METIMRSCYEPDREETIDKILCNRCKHRHKGITCDAFPDGIPTFPIVKDTATKPTLTLLP